MCMCVQTRGDARGLLTLGGDSLTLLPPLLCRRHRLALLRVLPDLGWERLGAAGDRAGRRAGRWQPKPPRRVARRREEEGLEEAGRWQPARCACVRQGVCRREGAR